MRPYILAMLLTLIPAIGFAEVVKLTPEHRKILQNSPFKEIHSVRELPISIIALCADSNGRLAEPGQKWQVTDVISDINLPQKRLIWAAKSERFVVVHYERGGIGVSRHVLLASLEKGNHAKILWQGVVERGKQIKNFEGFLKALKNNQLDDRYDYAH